MGDGGRRADRQGLDGWRDQDDVREARKKGGNEAERTKEGGREARRRKEETVDPSNEAEE